MKKIRLASKILITLTKDKIRYQKRLLLDIISMLIRCGVLLILYWYVFKLNGGTINNTIFPVVAWSMFFYFCFMIFRLRSISKLIMDDVRSGNVEVLFSKPISYLFYRFWWQIGSGLYSFVIVAIFGATALYFIVGFPTTMQIVIFIPTFIIIFLGGIVLSLFMYSTVGLLAFWIEDIHPVFWIIDKATMILGGSYLPVALFPALMYKIAIYSPFGASQFITHTVYENWRTNWPKLFFIQLLWILILGFLMYFLYRRARKKVSVNGG